MDSELPVFSLQSAMFGATRRWLLTLASTFALCTIVSANYKLKLVHVIFQHGERTPSSIENGGMYPNDPYLNYSFYPEEHDGLTNTGKLTMYNLGVYLRRRFDVFLGKLYTSNVTIMRTTDTVRTMMSAQLVNAGLWPPMEFQSWHEDLPWMPIPVEYVKGNKDVLMWSHKCSTFIREYKRNFYSNEVQALFEPYQEFFDKLSRCTGLNITSPKEVLSLYQTLEAEINYKLTLPSWTKDYFPNGNMYNVTLLEYEISNWNTLLKRIFGGPLVKEMLKNVMSYIEGTMTNERRMMLYSGHYTNIVSVLQTLGLWYPHIPDFGSAILLELHRDDSIDDYGIQVLYYTGKTGRTISMIIPGCTAICSLDKFTFLLKNVIPDDVNEQCGTMMMSVEAKQFVGNSGSCPLTCSLIVLYLWMVLSDIAI